MGIGMILIVPPNSTDQVLEELTKHKKPACVIGEIVEGSCQVEILR
jgi:phosphoribosylaminoimidazole (AIR) synthetase